MATPFCLACHLEDGDLQPLYADRAADAQPIAWAHAACLVVPTAEEAEQEIFNMEGEDLEQLKNRLPRRVRGND